MSELIDLQERMRSRRVATQPASDDPDAVDDLASYGLLRSSKERVLMLEFRLLDGTQDAFALALLERILYNSSQGITLRFAGVLVTIEGENLAARPPSSVGLLDGLHRHRVPWIAEIDAFHAAVKSPQDILVTKIHIETAY
jgi:hypothetical protein